MSGKLTIQIALLIWLVFSFANVAEAGKPYYSTSTLLGWALSGAISFGLFIGVGLFA